MEEQKTMEFKEEKNETLIKMDKPKSKKKMNIGRKIGWAVVIVVLFVVVVQILVADKYSAQVLVIEGEKQVGVNPTTEKLDFGDLSADTSATRFVTLKAGGMDTYIWVWEMGKIAELMQVSENNFVISEGEEKRLEFSLYMPPSAPVGDKYTGNVWIFKLPKFW